MIRELESRMIKEKLKDVALLSLKERSLGKRERFANSFPTYPEISNRNQKKLKLEHTDRFTIKC